MDFACIHIWTSNMTRMNGLERLLHGVWFNREWLLKLEEMTEMGCGRVWWDWPEWVGMSCLLSFPAQVLGNREGNSKKQTENKRKQTALPPAPGEGKELLVWDALKYMWVQKVISKSVRNFKNSLNTRHHLCLVSLWAIKCWRLKEWCWKDITRCLPCCSFSLAYLVDHHQWQSIRLERPLALPGITDLTLCELPEQLPVCVPSPQQTWGNLD